MRKKSIRKRNEILTVGNKIHIYSQENEYITTISKDSAWVLDRVNYGYISRNKATGYIITCFNKRAVTLHSVLLDKGDTNLVCDHINGIISDNTLENLQLVTQLENIAKKSKVNVNISDEYRTYQREYHREYRLKAKNIEYMKSYTANKKKPLDFQ